MARIDNGICEAIECEMSHLGLTADFSPSDLPEGGSLGPDVDGFFFFFTVL